MQRRQWIFGLSESEYEAIREFQNGRCAICRSSFQEDGSDIYVDHDHDCCSGRRSCGVCVRGFLCNRCKTALGQLQESPKTIERAIRYLESNRRPFLESHSDWHREKERHLISHMVSRDEYVDLLETQGGACAVCGVSGVPLEIDHDHSCHPGLRSCRKCVRGLTCMRCNKGLGLMLDSADRLRAALEYLQHPPRSSLSS
ncbi:endonuclease domain-containing protein [Helcobacillus massiliensis]